MANPENSLRQAPAVSDDPVDEEIQALRTVYYALLNIDPGARVRIIKWTIAKLDIPQHAL